MIDTIAYVLISLSALVFISLGILYFYVKYKHTKRIETIFNLDNTQILSREETPLKEYFRKS